MHIPETLQDSLMARLDRAPLLREVAQLGSVLGREFAYDMISALAGIEEEMLQSGLGHLVVDEPLYQRGTPGLLASTRNASLCVRRAGKPIASPSSRARSSDTIASRPAGHPYARAGSGAARSRGARSLLHRRVGANLTSSPWRRGRCHRAALDPDRVAGCHDRAQRAGFPKVPDNDGQKR